jgi:hypothetical protein
MDDLPARSPGPIPPTATMRNPLLRHQPR